MGPRSETELSAPIPTAGTPGPACPVAPDLVDGTAARIGALLSLLVVAGSLLLGWSLGALALALDFGLRAAGRPGLSPVARAAAGLRRLGGWPPSPTNAGPKRFAAAVGCAFSTGVGLAMLAGWFGTALGLGLVLGLCAGLEAFAGFCVACQLYPWLMRGRQSRPT
ncbi:MAG: DUF4395 domain-containing protein [Holophagaceae bacterium]